MKGNNADKVSFYISFLPLISCSEGIKMHAELLNEGPAEYKCAISGQFLREAVSLPCCGKVRLMTDCKFLLDLSWYCAAGE